MQDALGHRVWPRGPGFGQRCDVLFERGRKRRWRREQTLLEKPIDEGCAETVARFLGVLFTAGAVVTQLAMNLALFRSVRDFERLQGAPGVQSITFRIDQIAFQATDHHLAQTFLVGENVARETLVVEQFQQ